jgi:hypothetical protein
MTFSRRNFIRIVGGGTLAAAVTACAKGAMPDPRLPWSLQERDTDPLRHALSVALLAPNPHNRQPWMVDLHSPTSATLYCDPERDLPETDPFDRQITIGLGCFLELLAMGAQDRGMQARFELFPEGSDAKTLDRRPVATIKLSADPTARPDPLFAHIPQRRTNRKSFSDQRPDPALLQQIAGSFASVQTGSIHDEGPVQALRDLTMEAARIEFATPRTHLETVRLMRIGKREIAQNPDGLAIDGPAMGILKTVGIVTRKTLADPTSTAYKQGRDGYVAAAASAAGFIWIATPGNSRQDQIAAGRAYVRQNLMATKLGLAMHPLSQALQEYPEMEKPLTRAHQLTSTSGQRLQMLARVGYAEPVAAAPRFPLSAKLIQHGNTSAN